MKRRARAGFTLIELMTVVAILGVLSAIAIPNLMGQSRKAKGSQRNMQIRLIETSAKRYFEENLHWPTWKPQGPSTLSSTWNPAVLSSTSFFDPDQADWKDLMVPVEGKSRFQYQLTGTSTAANEGGFVLTVRSDLDGNNVQKVITRTWTLNKTNWGVTEVVTGDLTE